MGKEAWEGGVERWSRGGDVDTVLVHEVLKTIKLSFLEQREEGIDELEWGGCKCIPCLD